jgi:hypothetical protein
MKQFAALVLCSVALFACHQKQASIDYSEQYAQTSDANRATQATAEAMDTQDVLGTLSQMLGAPDQYDVVTSTNVRFVRDLDELNDTAYDRYTLRIADNMPVVINIKESLPMRVRIEETLLEYPYGFVAVNKQDRIIGVAMDRLEAQALAQLHPRVFYVMQGDTLQETLSRWSAQADWKMQYVVNRDYNMVAPAVIFGDYSAQGGALDQLLGTFRYSDQPLRAQFMRNRVVVIRDNAFDSNIMAVSP